MKRSSLKRQTILSQIYLLLLIEVTLNFIFVNSTLAQNITKKIALDRQFISNPHTVEGFGGGDLAAAEVVKTQTTATGYCDGFVDRRPNHVLSLSSFFEFLKIEVDSSVDTTILIKGPGGVWCNDDFQNANPTIEGEWQPGTYQIWIGSYQQNVNHRYRIRITDLRP